MFTVHYVRRHLWRCLAAAAALVPVCASAQVLQEQAFFNNLNTQCLANEGLPSPNQTLRNICFKAFGPQGGPAGGTYSAGVGSANVGSTGSYGNAGQSGLQRQREAADDEAKNKRKKSGAGSGDFTAGPFGGFVTVQRSNTTRALTDLENGYNAKLDGVLVGLDRRFGDSLVTGLTAGHNNVDTTYLNDAGKMTAHNTTLMLYTSYLPAPSAYLGAYLGAGKGHQDATRRIVTLGTSGDASSSTDSSQTLGGVSAGYDWYSGALAVGINAAVDSVRNRLDASTESGNTGLELAYPEQRTSSLTSTLGTRISYRSSFTWGAITPSVRAAYIHEYKDNQRTVSPTLAAVPSVVLPYTTDAPDRDYYISGAGATMEVGRGTQFFVDYEKRSGHRFIETWAASVGMILEF